MKVVGHMGCCLQKGVEFFLDIMNYSCIILTKDRLTLIFSSCICDSSTQSNFNIFFMYLLQLNTNEEVTFKG